MTLKALAIDVGRGPHLAVLGAARVQRDSLVLEEGLHLGAHHVALGQHRPHVQLVLHRPPPLQPQAMALEMKYPFKGCFICS